ncbi:helix-turn-helix domain-containing protein [Rhodococcus sp. 1R11]|nr:helix-turn-helix domain-containing protein [Rhodococcus sp. 1R11]
MLMENSHIDGSASDLLSVGQVASDWGVSVRTIQRYVTDGRIAATRLPSGRYRIRRSDADAALTHSKVS